MLLAAQPVIARGIRRGEEGRGPAAADRAPDHRTLVFENGRVRAGPVARAVLRIFGAGARRDSLRLHSLEVAGRPVLFTQPGEGPALLESPTAPGLYVVERDDRLWLLADSGASQLTADTVAGIARDTLRSRTGETGPHLYWATRPLWSPDGSAVAYVTNRSWMLARESSQETWLADLRSRRERPLLSERGAVYSPEGWLGSEVVYTARGGGLFAVDVRSGVRRTLAPGVAVAFSRGGSRLLYMTAAGDTVRGHVLTERGVVDVPDPPPGERLDFGGAFSPEGDRLVLGTSVARDSGMTRALYVLELGAKELTPLVRWSFRADGRHPHGLPAWLDDSTLLVTRLDRATGRESSALVRLPPPR